jgi:hypothetical protein
MLAQATLPLAESGYYVIPVSLASETFKQNGLANAADIHEVPVRSCVRSSAPTPRCTSTSPTMALPTR